jgi:hypothetical protein
VWKILHDGVMYEERGPVVSKARAQRRAAKMIREHRRLDAAQTHPGAVRECIMTA